MLLLIVDGFMVLVASICPLLALMLPALHREPSQGLSNFANTQLQMVCGVRHYSPEERNCQSS